MLRSGRFWFALIVASVLLLPGLFLVGRTLYRLLTYETATGTAGFVARGRRGISSYKISYQAKDGKSYSVGAAAASWLGLGYEAQEQVKVIYPASDPAAGVVATFYGLWFWPLFVVLCPLIFILPVTGWVRQGIEDNRLADLAVEETIARERRRLGRRRERRGRGRDDY